MGKRCPNCNVQFTLRDINKRKNAEIIKCPSCRRTLVESGISKIIVMLLVVLTCFLVMNNITSFWFRALIIFWWAFVINILVRPMIIKYKLEEKNKAS